MPILDDKWNCDKDNKNIEDEFKKQKAIVYIIYLIAFTILATAFVIACFYNEEIK
jgi:uncharacterized membrane protein